MPDQEFFAQKDQQPEQGILKTEINPKDPFMAFPGIVTRALDAAGRSDRKRLQEVLSRRFGLEDAEQYTLEDIAQHLSLTRERVRQIEQKAISSIRRIITNSDNQLFHDLSDELLESYNKLERYLSSAGCLFTSLTIEEYADAHGYSKLDSSYTDLLMDVLGYKKGPASIIGFRGQLYPIWYTPSSQGKTPTIISAFRALNSLYDNAWYISVFETTIEVISKTNGALSNDDIYALLKAIKDIEICDDRILVSFTSLRSAADKAYRVLLFNGSPMHFTDITSEMNRLQGEKVLLETNVRNQLVGDTRFCSIGRSGLWSLSEWEDIPTLTIADTLVSLLHGNGEPMELDEIVNAAKTLRPDAARKSILTYLNSDKRFCKTREGFALSTWRLIPSEKRALVKVPQNEFNTMLLEELGDAEGIRLADLVVSLREKTGMSDIGVRGRIKTAEIQGICQASGGARKMITATGANPTVEMKTPKMEMIKNGIMTVLRNQPNIPITKGELYQEVNKRMPCLKATYYQCLSKITDVRSYKEGNSFFVVFEP